MSNETGSKMPISPDYVVVYLCKRMGFDKNNYGIGWSEDGEGGFFTTVNDVKIHLSEPHFGGVGGGPRICLVLFKEGKQTGPIIEPTIHFSQSPLGKFLWRITCGQFPRGPTDSEEKAKEQLRVGLETLFNRVGIQSDRRSRVLGYDQRKNLQHERDTAKQSEEIRQELFQEITGLRRQAS